MVLGFDREPGLLCFGQRVQEGTILVLPRVVGRPMVAVSGRVSDAGFASVPVRRLLRQPVCTNDHFNGTSGTRSAYL